MIIAMDGASTDVSVALATPTGQELARSAWTTERRQSAELLPRLVALLAERGEALERCSAIAVGTGPGSYTGLRVTMALAKGLALALERPIVGVPSLVAWLEADPDARAAVTRAGAREAFVLVRGDDAVRVADREALGRLTGPFVAPTELGEAFALRDARSPVAAAGTIARMAALRLEQEAGGDELGRLEPIYLRAPRGVAVESREAVRWL